MQRAVESDFPRDRAGGRRGFVCEVGEEWTGAANHFPRGEWVRAEHGRLFDGRVACRRVFEEHVLLDAGTGAVITGVQGGVGQGVRAARCPDQREFRGWALHHRAARVAVEGNNRVGQV